MGKSTASHLESPSDVNRLAVERHQAIAVRAYFRAQTRGFEPGHELDDWLAAEQETDAMEVSDLACGPPPARRRKGSTRKVAHAADRPSRQASPSGKPVREGPATRSKARREKPST